MTTKSVNHHRGTILKKPEPREPTFLQIVHSLLASFFGVQSQANMDRDEQYIEKHGIKIYIITGFILVLLLLAGLFVLVQIIVRVAA